MAMIRPIKCEACGGNINLDFDNLISYCPYCGASLMIESSIIKDILIEKEKTKQVLGKEQIQLEKEKFRLQNENNKEKYSAISEIALILLIVILVIVAVIYTGFIYPNIR